MSLDSFQDRQDRFGFEPDAGLRLIVEWPIETTGVEVKSHRKFVLTSDTAPHKATGPLPRQLASSPIRRFVGTTTSPSHLILMSDDPNTLQTEELKARVGQLRRYL
jgi:hypothetical protein